MASFTGGDALGALVVEVGHYATKMGWAGDDVPKSYFRSNVAVLRGEKEDGVKSNSTRRQRRPIQQVKYDYYHAPIVRADQSDGQWQVLNPVDIRTGLWVDDERAYTIPSTGTSTQGHASHHTAQHDDHDDMKAALRPSEYPADCEGADWAELLSIFIQHGYSTALAGGPYLYPHQKSRPPPDSEASTSATDSLRHHPLLLVERSYNPAPIRQQTLECLFEDLQVPAAFLARDAVMSCYGCGRTSGTVLDMGSSGTTVTPVFDGYVEAKGIRRSPVGTRAMDEFILQILDQLHHPKPPVMPLYQVRQLPRPPTSQDALTSSLSNWNTTRARRPDFHHAARLFLAQQCREEGAGAAVNTAAAAAASTSTAPANFQAPHKSFELPDGTVLDIPSSQRFAVADYLFGHDEASTQRRHDLVQTHRDRIQAHVQAISAAHDAMDRARLEGTGASSTLGDVAGSSSADDRFSEAAAVGISKRRVGQDLHYKGGGGQAGGGIGQRSSSFSNMHLLKACSKAFQTLADQQLTASPLAALVCDAAYRCDREQQASLLGNIILGGGGACLGPTEQAVPDLIRDQVEALLHAHTPGWRVKVLTPGIPERAILSWLGGSILGSLGSFHEMWITRAEYDEWGSAIVNRKCP